MNNSYELLSPAGDLERLETALRFGADAVYCGGPMLQLRSGSVGFTMETLAEGVKKCHEADKKIYVTVNAFANNDEIDAAGEYAQALYGMGVDAVIVSDLGLMRTIRKAVPNLTLHVSTQANCLNYAAANAYYDMGVKRIVLGREMSLKEIRELRRRIPDDLELEAFVHGAMCMSYSGRCMISAYLTDRSANRGACTQSCRWKFHLTEETRPCEFFPVVEDERGTTILSSFDMNCIDFLDQIMDAGVTSFKLEGRMKSPFYVATVTNAYRKRIDGILNGDASKESLQLLRRELCSASHRPYSSGFYFGAMKKHAPDDGVYLQDTNFVGVVKRIEGKRVFVEVRNRFFAGDRLEILSPDTLNEALIAQNIVDANGVAVEAAARPAEIYSMDLNARASVGDLLRVRIQN